MSVVFLVVIMLLVAAIVLRGTWAWWLPGALLVVAMFITFGMIEPLEDDSGLGALANGVLFIAGLGLGALSLIAFALGGIKSNKVKRPELGAPAPIDPLPTARVVRG